MALPVTIAADVGAQNSYHGPFKSSAGGFYVILKDDTAVEAWKADGDDPTDAFTEQDITDHPLTGSTSSMWIDQKDDVLYFIEQKTDGDVIHAQFDMANDVWIEITVGQEWNQPVNLLTETQALACSIAVRGGATGEIVIAYQGNPSTNKDMGGSFEYVSYAVSDDSGVGASWSVDNRVADVEENSPSEVDFTGPVIVRGTGTLGSERIHFFFKDDTNNDAYQRTLSGADALETFPSAFDDAVDESSNVYIFGRGVELEGVIYCPYRDDISIVNIASFVSADAPIIETTAGVSDTSAESGEYGLALDGSDLHMVYVDVVTDDIFRDINTGSGWGTDEDILVAVTATGISINIYDRDGPKLAYVYDDAGTVKYNEKPITHTFALLSDVNMGKQNSFHGPFET